MKVLILVLSNYDSGLYNRFLEAQESTWDSIEEENVKTFFYYGNRQNDEIIGNHIHLKIDETLHNCGPKTIKCFEQIINLEFDFVFRTNSSSYVDKKLLVKYLKDKPKKKYYSGVIGNHLGIPFCSGSGFFLSKDLVKLLVTNQNLLDYTYIDDVAIAKLLNSFNIELSQSERFDVIDDNIPTNFFHYRLKTENRNEDINRMKKIFNSKCNILQETSLN